MPSFIDSVRLTEPQIYQILKHSSGARWSNLRLCVTRYHLQVFWTAENCLLSQRNIFWASGTYVDHVRNRDL